MDLRQPFCTSGIPIALRVVYRTDFAFHHLGFSYPIAFAAVTWIGFISIAFILPSLNVSDPVYGDVTY